MIDYFKSHIRKVYRELFNSEMDHKVELAFNWISRRGGKAIASMMVTNYVAGCKSIAQVNELLIEMAERNLGVVTQESTTGKGPKSTWITLCYPANKKPI